MVARTHCHNHVPLYTCTVCSLASSCMLTRLSCEVGSSFTFLAFCLVSFFYFSNIFFCFSILRGMKWQMGLPQVCPLHCKAINQKCSAKVKVTSGGGSQMPITIKLIFWAPVDKVPRLCIMCMIIIMCKLHYTTT